MCKTTRLIVKPAQGISMGRLGRESGTHVYILFRQPPAYTWSYVHAQLVGLTQAQTDK